MSARRRTGCQWPRARATDTSGATEGRSARRLLEARVAELDRRLDAAVAMASERERLAAWLAQLEALDDDAQAA